MTGLREEDSEKDKKEEDLEIQESSNHRGEDGVFQSGIQHTRGLTKIYWSPRRMVEG